MKMQDLTVEVRDRTLKRIGVIHPRDLRLRADMAFNNVGTWELKLPADHAMSGPLRAEGAGVVVTGPDGLVLFSGPVSGPVERKTTEDPLGTVTFAGLTDDVILSDRLAYPDPQYPANGQRRANDVRENPAESLMHNYVAVNIGRAAVAPRKDDRLVHGPDLGRGTTLTKSPRFQNLGELLSEIAITDGLGFRVVQQGGSLVFETYKVVDRSKTVRLDLYSGTLASNEIEVSAPAATTAIVAGQGEGVKRMIVEVTRPEDIEASRLWGRRIERFVDQRQTEVVAELLSAGNELLLADGGTQTAVRAVGGDDQTMAYGVDWGLGDRISIVDGGREIASVVTRATLLADSKGVRIGLAVGERGTVTAAARISSLERNAEGGGGARVAPGMISMMAGVTVPRDWLLCDGREVSRFEYAALYSAVGNIYGAGDGLSTFNLPDLRGRVPVGIDTGDPSFNSAGKKGGAKTHRLSVTEMPSHTHVQDAHTHTQNTHTHTQALGGTLTTYAAASGVGVGGRANSAETSAARATNVATTATNQSTGGGAEHNNLQPYITMNYFIAT